MVAVGAAAIAGSGSTLETFPGLLGHPVHPPGLLDDSLRQHSVAGGDQVSGPVHHLLNSLQISIDTHHLHRVDDVHSVRRLEPGHHACNRRPQPAEVLQQPPLVRVALQTVQFFSLITARDPEPGHIGVTMTSFLPRQADTTSFK